MTDPSCELHPVIGLSTEGVCRLRALIGWPVGRGRGHCTQRFCREHRFNRLASGQTVGTHTHIYIYTDWLVGWRCKGKFGPVGVTSVGASVCVCNIMLSRRGVAGSNRSTPRSRPRWVISHSLGNSSRTQSPVHTHTHMRHIWPAFSTTYILMQRFRQGGHKSTVLTHSISFLHSYKVGSWSEW